MPLVTVLIPVSGAKIGDSRWHVGSLNTSGEQILRTGWLAANGAEVSRATYAALFAVIGTTYGNGNNTSTFNLPNFTDGRNPLSRGATNFSTRGSTGGEKTHVITGAEEPPHTHTYVDSQAPNSGSGAYGQIAGVFPDADYGGNRVDNTTVPNGQSGGAATAHQNMPPVQVVGGMIICYK